MQFSTFAFITLAGRLASAADVGASGVNDTKDGGLGGIITVTNNTTLTISQYTLKSASAPALCWWGSTTSHLPKGFRINNERVSAAATTDSITITLNAGHTAADFGYVGFWCEKLNANFGQAQLVVKDGSSGGTAGPPTSTGGAASSSPKAGAAAAQGLGSVALVAAANVLGIAAVFV